jgi:putative toxin-antitoxin system antitoxin component (TIGR02293 family)
MAAATSLSNMMTLLGGKTVVGRPHSRLALVGLARKGLPYTALEAIGERLQLSLETLAKALGLSPRTLARRKDEGTLDLFESERVLRLADVVIRGIEVFGSIANTKTWLQQGSRALGGAAPLSLLDTDMGAEAVRDELGRIEHGVFS